MSTSSSALRTSGRGVLLVAAATCALAALATLVAGLLLGAPQAWGVAVGSALVVGFFGLGALMMMVVLRDASGAGLATALMTYALQVLLMFLALLGLKRAGLLGPVIDPVWLAATIAVATLCWTSFLMLTAARARVPLYDQPGSRDRGEVGAP